MRDNSFPSDEDVPGFLRGTEEYIAAMEVLCREMLLPVIAKALGMAEPAVLLEKYFRDPRHFLTLNRYPAPERPDEDRAGIPMHATTTSSRCWPRMGSPGCR